MAAGTDDGGTPLPPASSRGRAAEDARDVDGAAAGVPPPELRPWIR